MKNPWLKKDPFMSIWLSGANSVLGTARGRATAEARRRGTRAIAQTTKQVADFWTTALTGKTPKRRKRKL